MPSLLLLAACGPRWPAVEPFAPAPAPLHAPVTVAVVGNLDPPAPGLLADIRAQGADLVVVAGDLVADPSARTWSRARERLGELPTRVAVGAAELEDPGLRGVHATSPEGSWGHLTVQTEAGAVRWLLLDPRAPLDQRFWLPGVLSPPLAAAVVVVGDAAPELVEQATSAVTPGVLSAVVQGGEGSNSFSLPEGPWGTARITAGAGGGPTVAVEQAAVTKAFAQRFTEVLVAEVPASEALFRRGEAFRPPAFATTGWWEVRVAPDASLSFAWRRRGSDGVWAEVFRSTWHPDRGHQAE